jgi:hypothetical protein
MFSQAGPEPLVSRDPPASAPQIPGITRMCHCHAPLREFYFCSPSWVLFLGFWFFLTLFKILLKTLIMQLILI